MNLLVDYLRLRRAVGILGVALMPVLFAIAGPRESLSAYYHSPARDVFVGVLFLLAGMLWVYRGHDHGDRVLSALAALALPVVALAPMGAGPWGVVHLVAAGVFFLSSAFLADRFGRGCYRPRTFRALGVGIVAALASVIVGVPVVIAESAALVCFGAAWALKGRSLEAVKESLTTARA